MKKKDNEKVLLKKPIKKEETRYRANEIRVIAYGECHYGFSGYYTLSKEIM